MLNFGHFGPPSRLGVVIGTSIQPAIFFSPAEVFWGFLFGKSTTEDVFWNCFGSDCPWLEFFGPDFAIWRGFRWLDESQVDSRKDRLKRKFEEPLLYFSWGL